VVSELNIGDIVIFQQDISTDYWEGFFLETVDPKYQPWCNELQYAQNYKSFMNEPEIQKLFLKVNDAIYQILELIAKEHGFSEDTSNIIAIKFNVIKEIAAKARKHIDDNFYSYNFFYVYAKEQQCLIA
jgi:hypothetical protein